MPTSQALHVAANVRAEMARHGHTQVSLAKKLGVTQQMLSRRLSGHVDFGITELHAIANVLGVPLANLIDTDKANAS